MRPGVPESLLQTIREAWAWRGFEPVELVDLNAFGEAIVRTEDQAFWRISPDELSLNRIADTPAAFETLRLDPAFAEDWRMERLVEVALQFLGPTPLGRCYYFVIPPVLGGAYDAANMQFVRLTELHSLAGDLACQIDGLPDGAQIELKVVD